MRRAGTSSSRRLGASAFARLLFLALQAPLLFAQGPAGEPWLDRSFEVAPHAMLAAAERRAAEPGTEVTVFLREVAYRFDAAHRVTYRQRRVYRVESRRGAQSRRAIEIVWAPWYQARPVARARVIGAGGVERWLDTAAAQVHPVAAGRRLWRAPLPALEVGDVVEEEIVLHDERPFAAAGIAGMESLALELGTQRARLQLEAPREVALRYTVRGRSGLEPSQTFAENRVRLSFEIAGDGRAGATAPAQAAQVLFSTGRDWAAVATDYGRRIDAALSGADLAPWSAQLPPAVDPGHRARQAVELIRDLADHEVPDLGLGVPGIGDGEDRAALAVGLLRRQSIPASVALVRVGPQDDVDPRLPGLGRFHHALLVIDGERPIWADPSDAAARFGELSAALQNRRALIASPRTQRLRRTPAANSIDNRTVETRDVFLADYGLGRVVETSRFYGEPERRQREARRMGSSADRRELYREYVRWTYRASGLARVEESDPDHFAMPLGLELEAIEVERVRTDFISATVAIRREDLLAGLPRAVLEGSSPLPRVVEVDPHVVEWRYRIHLPVGFVPRDLPTDRVRRFGPARLERTLHQDRGARDGATVELGFRFDSGPRYLTSEQALAMGRAVRDFIAEPELVLRFEHAGAMAFAAGRRRAAFAAFRDAISREAAGAVHRARLSQALLRVGLGREALAQARRAVELEGESAIARWALGVALEHDELGRRFRPGFPRAAAVSELEAAIRIDPDEALFRNELAFLLEQGDDGRRYGTGAELDRAIEQYLVLRDRGQRPQPDLDLLALLYRAERWHELYAATLAASAALSPEPPPTEGADPAPHWRIGEWHLAALAVLRGTDAAHRESHQLADGPEAASRLLRGAAQHLVTVRRYGVAAALLRAAAGAPASDPVRPDDPLALAQRHEEIALDTSEPSGLARGLLVLIGRAHLDAAEIALLFHPDYLDDRGVAGDGGVSGLSRFLESMRRERLTLGELPPAAVADLALAVSELRAEGDAQRGFRIAVRNMLKGEIALTVYVTTYGGRLVIAGVGDELGQLGKEVLRRLEARDLAGAHQWLEWARDAQPDLPLGGDRDPWGFRPFARFWTRGTGAFHSTMRLGAAILMAEQPEAAEAIPILEQALADWKASPTRTVQDARRRRAVQLALFLAYTRIGENGKLAELGQELLAAEPDSKLAFLGLAGALVAERRWDELEELTASRLERRPDDPDALRFQARRAFWLRDVGRVEAIFQRLEQAGQLRSVDLNLWAWLQLFRDPIPEEAALALAERGVELSGRRDRSLLHTLATLQAELGHPEAAYTTLLESLELQPRGEPDSDDAFVIGRIAEEYGLREIARHYYAQVERHEIGESFSTFELAARRLQQWPEPSMAAEDVAH